MFENVGGEPFLQGLRRLNDFARIAVCGLIASYEGPTTSLPDMRIFLVRRIKVEGFIISDRSRRLAAGDRRTGRYAAAGRLRWRETVREGLESAPQALIDLLHGGNFGKMLVNLISNTNIRARSSGGGFPRGQQAGDVDNIDQAIVDGDDATEEEFRGLGGDIRRRLDLIVAGGEDVGHAVDRAIRRSACWFQRR